MEKKIYYAYLNEDLDNNAKRGSKRQGNGKLIDQIDHTSSERINWDILQGYWRNCQGQVFQVKDECCISSNSNKVYPIDFDGNDYILSGKNIFFLVKT